MKLDKITADNTKIFNTFNMKIPTLTSNKTYSSYEQSSSDLTKFTLLKSPEKYLHELQLNKHLFPMNLEGETLLQIQKRWDSILSALCQYLSTNKI